MSNLFLLYFLLLFIHVQLFVTSLDCSTPGFQVLHYLLEFSETHFHSVSDAVQPSHPSVAPSPPAPNPSQHRGLLNESGLCIRWPKYWSFSFSISPSSEYSGLISFWIDWFDHLVVQGTLEPSPAPEFKSINSLALRLLYGPALTYVQLPEKP